MNTLVCWLLGKGVRVCSAPAVWKIFLVSKMKRSSQRRCLEDRSADLWAPKTFRDTWNADVPTQKKCRITGQGLQLSVQPALHPTEM